MAKKIILNRNSVELLNVALRLDNDAPAGRPIDVHDECDLVNRATSACLAFNLNPDKVLCKLVGRTTYTEKDVNMVGVKHSKWILLSDIQSGKVSFNV